MNEEAFDTLTDWLRSELLDQPAEVVRAFVSGSQDVVLQWRLLSLLGPEGRASERLTLARDWLLQHSDALSLFLCSGDVEADRWADAAELLLQLADEDPAVAEGGVRLRLWRACGWKVTEASFQPPLAPLMTFSRSRGYSA